MKKKEKLKWKPKNRVHFSGEFQILKYGKQYDTKNFLLTNKNSEIGWFDKLGDAKKCAQIIHNG